MRRSAPQPRSRKTPRGGRMTAETCQQVCESVQSAVPGVHGFRRKSPCPSHAADTE